MAGETCIEKLALIAAYQRALREYSEAVQDLNLLRGTSSKDVFGKILEKTEQDHSRMSKALETFSSTLLSMAAKIGHHFLVVS